MITSPNNRIYIGSTIDIDQRFKSYKGLKCKSQQKLYNSFIKYGCDSHIFEVIWAGNIVDMLKYESMIGINFNALDDEFGLNLKLPKSSDIYKCISAETSAKMSLAQVGNKKGLGRVMSDQQRLDCSLRQKGSKAYWFGKKHTDEYKLNMSRKTKGSKRSESARLNTIKGRQKSVNQYDKDMVFIKCWESIKEASLKLNINKSKISAVCKGARKTSGGFKWKYKEK